MGYPIHRLLRLRRTPELRSLIQQTHLEVSDLIAPIIVVPGKGVRRPITPLPGQMHFSPDILVEECRELEELGIPAVLLFGLPEEKNHTGSEAWDDNGIIQQAIRNIKEKTDKLVVITDVCLCAYTEYGHCGIVKEKNGRKYIDNDETLEALGKIGLSHAKAGADIVSPSSMADGQVKIIRERLDEEGFHNVAIMGCAAKFSSGFFTPFREAAESAPKFGDRKPYQLDYHNADEAIREIEFEIEEGADIVMVKPALAYLDIIYRARRRFSVPIACFNVSGEYAMLKSAAQNGWISEKDTVIESLVGMRRAGADMIVTYFAKDIAIWFGR